MRKPKRPPVHEECLKSLPESWPELWTKPEVLVFLQRANHEYWSWDQLRSHPRPAGVGAEAMWALLKLTRSQRQTIPLKDHKGDQFSYWIPAKAQEDLYAIETRLPKTVKYPESYLARNLMEEAIASSRLEGAVSTIEKAKELLRENKTPRNTSEQMIVNNYRTIQLLRELKNQPLTPETIHSIQRSMTENTLDRLDAAGRLRRHEERVYVVDDRQGEVLYIPPPADQLEERVNRLCDFANDDLSSPFTHPLVKAILLHLWLGYDHPYCDGNGRTARALFYWYMLRQGFRSIEYVSISHIILQAPSKYALAYLNVETDDNDATYFLMYHLKTLRRAIAELHRYVEDKKAEMEELVHLVRVHTDLNHRQQMLLMHALKHPNAIYTIESHMHSHNVTYPTARSDMLKLAEKDYLILTRAGRKFRFQPILTLQERLQNPMSTESQAI